MPWFEPAGVKWTYASRRLIAARLIVGVVPAAGLAAAVGAAAALLGAPVAASAVCGLATVAWWVWVVTRQVTAHGWVERQDDLMVKRGRIFRRLTVVPYGRMQYVEVNAGPVARAFGIARVQLHTASPGTDAHLSGVPTEEAARLRDRLTVRGEARLAGL
jgi:membrane protein YdbS with pleckstrin-like domain